MKGQASDTGKGGKSRKRRLLIVLAFVGVAVVAGGSGVGLSWWQYQQQERTHPGEVEFSEQFTEAQKQTLNSDYDKAHSTLDEALKDPNTPPSEMHDLYIQQGVVYENENKMDEAVESYKKAESYKESLQAAQSIARIAVQKDDKQLAITYYKKAILLLKNESPQAQDNLKKYFEDAIAHLEGS